MTASTRPDRTLAASLAANGPAGRSSYVQNVAKSKSCVGSIGLQVMLRRTMQSQIAQFWC